MDASSGDAGRSLPERLKARRKELRLGQAEAARRANVGRMAWYEWEAGRRQPRDYNHSGIDEAMEWEPGGIEVIMAGGDPTPIPDIPIPLTPLQREALTELDALIADRVPYDEAVDRVVEQARAALERSRRTDQRGRDAG